MANYQQSAPGVISGRSAAPQIISGPIDCPALCGIYGPNGVGKTTLAAGSPQPVFVDTEGGTNQLNVARFRTRTWADLVAAVTRLVHEDHRYKTLVLDSVDWAEKLLVEEVCRKAHKESLEDFPYGKGFTYVADEFARFLALLEKLRERGLNVILIGHSTIRKFEAPDAAGSYDRYVLKLSKPVAALTKEWVDALFFINFVTKLTEKDGKQKAVGGRERVIHTTHTAAWDAKNRYGLDDKLPCVIASLAPIFARSISAAAVAPTSPAPAAVPAATAAPPETLAPRPGPVLLITREQVDKLDLYWRTLTKTHEDRARAFAWVGCDSIDFTWDELTSDQADRLIVKLQEQMNKVAAASTSSFEPIGLVPSTANNLNR